MSLDSTSGTPLYRQLADSVSRLIADGVIQSGDKLPPTRELASQLGLNRTTIAAAYASLEQAGLIRGHVGRGSFVADPLPRRNESLPVAPLPTPILVRTTSAIEISFASSRPPAEAFPLEAFRRLSKEVIDSSEAVGILQLGPTHGYQPLRRYLLDDALEAGVARPTDDLIITSGCQQALDLIARIAGSDKVPVAVEDPVYHGLIRVFSRAGTELLPVGVDCAGLDVNELEQTLERYHPRLLMITPSFQNPTGTTLPLDRRKRIIGLTERYGVTIMENDIYSELRYRGQPVPTLKELDESGNTVLLRSYSKILFPGLRVGWVIGPRAFIARLAETKQISDLHSDQLSQAVVLRLTESGELRKHLERTRIDGGEKLATALAACKRFLPRGTSFTAPDGGMSLWIELPQPLSSDLLLTRAQERGVDFLPGRYFSVRNPHTRGLRISFGGLPADQITRGIQILGECAARELKASGAPTQYENAAVLV